MDWRRYCNIILYRTYAELKSEAQLSYMGYLWWVLEPLLNTVLFWFILVAVLEQSGVDAVGFLLVGSITWQWLNASVMASSGSIFEAGGMLKQIYLPKVVLPLISILSNTWKFTFVFALLIVWIVATGHRLGETCLALPLLLGLELLLILSIGLPIAAVMPYFPDARVTLDAFLRSLMLVSGIFFPVEKLPAVYQPYFYLNPMGILIESYRDVLLHNQWPNWGRLGYVTLFDAVGLIVAVGLHTRLDRSLVKAIQR